MHSHDHITSLHTPRSKGWLSVEVGTKLSVPARVSTFLSTHSSLTMWDEARAGKRQYSDTWDTGLCLRTPDLGPELLGVGLP